MPTLAPTSKRANVRRSFDAWVDAALGASFPSAIDHLDAPFSDEGLAEWIAADVLGPARPSPARFFGSGTTRAVEEVYVLHVNVFVRPKLLAGAAATRDRLERLRDVVAAALCEHVAIPVLDHDAVGTPEVGRLVCRAVSMDTRVPTPGVARQDLGQWAYSVNAGWTASYSA